MNNYWFIFRFQLSWRHDDTNHDGTCPVAQMLFANGSTNFLFAHRSLCVSRSPFFVLLHTHTHGINAAKQFLSKNSVFAHELLSFSWKKKLGKLKPYMCVETRRQLPKNSFSHLAARHRTDEWKGDCLLLFAQIFLGYSIFVSECLIDASWNEILRSTHVFQTLISWPNKILRSIY